MRSSPAGSLDRRDGLRSAPAGTYPESALLTPNCVRLPSAFAGECGSAAREAFAVADVVVLPVPSGNA